MIMVAFAVGKVSFFILFLIFRITTWETRDLKEKEETVFRIKDVYLSIDILYDAARYNDLDLT